MSRFKPGAQYVYEKADGITYAREFGAPASERFEIGRDWGRIDMDEWELWQDVKIESRTNPALKKVVDRAILMYRMSKNKPK